MVFLMGASTRKQVCCLELRLDKISTISADISSVAHASVTGDSNAVNGLLTLASNRADAGFVIGANTITNNIGGDYAVLDFNEFMDVASSGALARIAPTLELVKNGTAVVTINTSYQRHATGHDESSNGGTYTDYNPAAGDVWSLRTQRGSTQTDVLNVTLGHLSLRVIEKTDVLTTN